MRANRRLLIIAAILAVLIAAAIIGIAIATFPIHRAAERGDKAKLEKLLSENPSLINSRDKYKMTPLHWSAWKGHTQIVEFLLNKGADLAARTRGQAPLHFASRSGHDDIIHLLLEKGADVNAKGTFG